MKIAIDIDVTPQEMREFFGLPDIKPLQEDMLELIRENARAGGGDFDPLSLMKPLFPAQLQSMQMLQKVFMDAIEQAGTTPAASESSSSRRKPATKKTGAK